MAQYVSGFVGLSQTNSQIAALKADFSGMIKLDSIVDKVLNRLALNARTQHYVAQVKSGQLRQGEFDYWFADEVRRELGKVLGIVRAKAVAKARAAGAGSAASAVLRRTYKNQYAAALHILGNRKRLSSRERVVQEPTGGNSGIRRIRTVSDRTKQIRKYYGPDRSFILRFLEEGTDVRTANPAGPTGRGSMATYGARGNISPRSFFHTLQSDMDMAAKQLGITLIGHVEKYIETQFEKIGQ